jgi:hypothetical protein
MTTDTEDEFTEASRKAQEAGRETTAAASAAASSIGTVTADRSHQLSRFFRILPTVVFPAKFVL